MTESTALVPIKVEPPRSLMPSQQELSVIATLAKTVVLARGHAVPAAIDSPAKAAAIMLAGRELGVPPMSALRHIFGVNGRTEPDAQLLAGIIAAREPDASFEIVELSVESCTMRLNRPSRGIRAEYTYELEDAKKAGLLKVGPKGPGPWILFPKDMLRWAATKRLARAYAPDLINAVGGVSVSAAADLVSEVDIDLATIPREQLYSDGDSLDAPLVELAGGALADTETGEVIEDAATEADAEPFPVLPGSVREYLSWAQQHYQVSEDELALAHGSLVPAALHARGLPRLLAEIVEFARQRAAGAPDVGAPQDGVEAPSTEAAAEIPAEPGGPQPPRARTAKDLRLGEFDNVGLFYSRAFRELRLAGPRVRELAGVETGAAPEAVLAFEGEAGRGLDALWVELAKQVAGVPPEVAR